MGQKVADCMNSAREISSWPSLAGDGEIHSILLHVGRQNCNIIHLHNLHSLNSLWGKNHRQTNFITMTKM